jgi:thiosulfate dehydrogenase [quinone] large subunit
MALAERVTRRVYRSEQLPDPGFIKTLFSSPKMALLFLPLRVYIGWQWMTAGIEKINSPAWTRSGTALQGFLAAATKGAPGAKGAAIHYGWYHDFLQYMLNNQWYTWGGKAIAFGETAVGIALVIGAFVGVAAFFGAFMNFNYLLAGTASTNPVLFALAILLVLGWKVAGYLGADYYLLPAFGTPWKPGHVLDFTREHGERTVSAAQSLLGAIGFIAAFAVAAVVAVVANNQWSTGDPYIGYAVALLAVMAAWLVGEAVLTATHRADEEHTVPMDLKLGPIS